MKELYNEYFHIPKHGKIRDKVMLIRTAITAIIMIVCLAAMSMTAYAYFSYNVSSGSNIIKAADFDVTVSVTVTSNETSNTIEANEDGTYSLSSGTYSVSLTKAGTAQTGFCIVDTAIGDVKATYHTQQIGVDGEIKRPTLTFTLDLTEISGTTVVKFTPHWGTSHYYGYENLDSNPLYIKHEGDVKITVGTSNSISESDEEKETTSDETTGTETTPTEVIHTVAANETLSAIAVKYSVTVDQIAAYNELADKNNIQAGQKLKIPPADYVVPADTTEQTTTTPETTTAPETTTTPETTTSAETTTPPETTVTDPVETTAPAETTTSTETTGSPETSAPAETTEPAETTSIDTDEQTQPTTENSETAGAPTTEASE